MSYQKSFNSLLLVAALSGCSTVGSVASGVGSVAVGTVKAAVTVAGVGVSVATGVVGAAVVVKNISVGTTLLAVNAAISAASLVGNIVVWGISLSRSPDDAFQTMLTQVASNRFQSAEGRLIETKHCEAFDKPQVALLRISQKGESSVRVNGRECEVVSVLLPT
jgi:hypothetical protein